MRILLALTVVLALLGCSRPEEEGKGTSSFSGGPYEESEKLQVSIVPLDPGARDDLVAVVRGSVDRPRYRWQVNSRELSDQGGSRLTAGHFQKGDSVAVSVHLAGQNLTASTRIVNTPPVVVSTKLENSEIYHGIDITLHPEGADIDGDEIRYAYVWRINGQVVVGVGGPVLQGDLFRRGDRIRVEITPFDGEDEGPVYRSPEELIPNGPPRFVSTPPALEDACYRYRAVAEDPDGDDLLFALEKGPQGMSMDVERGLLTWCIRADQAGTHPVRIAVQDAGGLRAWQEFALNVSFDSAR